MKPQNHSGSLSVRLSGSGGIGLLFCKEVPWQIIPTNQYILRNEKVINFDLMFRIYKYIYIYTNFSYIDEPWWTNYFGNPMGPTPANYTDNRTEVGITAQCLEIFCHAARREVHQGSFFWTGLAFVAIFFSCCQWGLACWFEVISGVFVAGYCEDRIIYMIHWLNVTVST